MDSYVVARRELLRSAAALALVAACGPPVVPRAATPRSAPTAGLPRRFRSPLSIYSWFDLPDDRRSRELSGIAWDTETRTLWAVQDDTANNIVSIRPDARCERWSFGPVVPLDVAFPLDLEGIVVIPDGFVTASEKGPRVIEFDRKGKLRRDIPLPEHFAEARNNRSLESLTISPDGVHLFTTSEGALGCDGPMPTTTAGTRIRILRMTCAGDEADEHAYLTDPLPNDGGDYGVADLAAITDDELLVLERGWAPGFGNTARIYRVNVADPAASCTATPALASDSPVLQKTLVVDLATLRTSGLPPARQIEPSPLMDNYEGLAVGPVLPDGRASLILISDDNNRADQVARIVVLAVG